MKRYPLIIFTLLFVLSVILAHFYSISEPIIIYLIIGLSIISIYSTERFLKRNKVVKTAIILLGGFIISYGINCFSLNDVEVHPTSHEESIKKLQVREIIYKNDNYQSFISEDYNTEELFYSEYKGGNEIELAQTIIAKVKTKPIKKGLELPYEFNYNKYLLGKGIKSKIEVYDYKLQNEKAPLDLRIQKFVEDKINQSNLKDNSKGILLALTIGKKYKLNKEVKEDFSKAGLMHLLALSGLHIGILSFVLIFILDLIFPRSFNSASRVFVIFLLFFYSYISGFAPSILRASIMFGVIIISNISRRQANIYNSLSIAALILLLINPNNFFEIGFQLSFSAVLAIVSIFPLLKKLYYPKGKIIRYFYDIILVSLSAQIGTGLLSVYYFHSFPMAFLISNLIEIPLFTLLLFMSYAEITLFSLGINIAFLNKIYDFLVGIILKVSELIASLDFLLIEDILIKKYVLIIALLIIILSIILLKTKNKLFLAVVFTLTITLQTIWIYNYWDKKENETIMIAGGNIIVKKYNEYIIYENNLSTFDKLIKMENLANSKSELRSYFKYHNYYYTIIDSINMANKLTHENHKIVVCESINRNPALLISPATKYVIFNVKDYKLKSRWENYCQQTNINFHSSIDSLYLISQ